MGVVLRLVLLLTLAVMLDKLPSAVRCQDLSVRQKTFKKILSLTWLNLVSTHTQARRPTLLNTALFFVHACLRRTAAAQGRRNWRMGEPVVLIGIFVTLSMLLPLAFPCTPTNCYIRQGETVPYCPEGTSFNIRLGLLCCALLRYAVLSFVKLCSGLLCCVSVATPWL